MSCTSSASVSTPSPYRSASGASVEASRAVAATLSPRSSAASAQIRPKPFEHPVMNHTFESAIRPPAEMLSMRIASLVPASTEMLFALGLGDQTIGVTHECDY